MSMPTAMILPAYVSAALSASGIGTWRCSITGETIQGDGTFAATFGFNPMDARSGVAFQQVIEKLHPDDRKIFIRKADAVRDRGGYIVIECRVQPNPFTERWVLMRGRYEVHSGMHDAECIGHGIVVDVTNAKRASGSSEPIYLVSTDPSIDPELTPLQSVAGVALSLHQQIVSMDPANPALEAVVEMLLIVLGRQLAREIDPSDLEQI